MRDQRALVEHNVPGAGSRFQDMGREPTRVLVSGIAMDQGFLDSLNALYQSGAPVSLLMDAPVMAAFDTELTRLHLLEVQCQEMVGQPGCTAYVLALEVGTSSRTEQDYEALHNAVCAEAQHLMMALIAAATYREGEML